MHNITGLLTKTELKDCEWHCCMLVSYVDGQNRRINANLTKHSDDCIVTSG